LSIKRNWEWYILIKIISICSKIIVVDKKSYKVLLESGYSNIAYVPNPISLELEDRAIQLRSMPNIKSSGILLFIGHVIKEKGIYELVKASLQVSIVEKLIIIGPVGDRMKNELLSIVTCKKDREWLTFTGNLEKYELNKYLLNSTVIILPSYTEGFPNVIIEAMALGCAVIATEVGAIPDMLNISSIKPCGVCIKPKSIEELKNSIDYLLSKPQRAIELGKNGNERVLEEYTLAKVCKSYEEIWNYSVNND
jgi:glycosyltransferase involved in cell wall biosynthesis